MGKIKGILLSALPIVAAGAVAMVQAFADQKEAKRINKMESTINDLVEFTKMNES